MGGASGPGSAFGQFASIGDEIAYATRCLKAWRKRGDFLGDSAVIVEMDDRGLWMIDRRFWAKERRNVFAVVHELTMR